MRERERERGCDSAGKRMLFGFIAVMLCFIACVIPSEAHAVPIYRSFDDDGVSKYAFVGVDWSGASVESASYSFPGATGSWAPMAVQNSVGLSIRIPVPAASGGLSAMESQSFYQGLLDGGYMDVVFKNVGTVNGRQVKLHIHADQFVSGHRSSILNNRPLLFTQSANNSSFWQTFPELNFNDSKGRGYLLRIQQPGKPMAGGGNADTQCWFSAVESARMYVELLYADTGTRVALADDEVFAVTQQSLDGDYLGHEGVQMLSNPYAIYTSSTTTLRRDSLSSADNPVGATGRAAMSREYVGTADNPVYYGIFPDNHSSMASVVANYDPFDWSKINAYFDKVLQAGYDNLRDNSVMWVTQPGTYASSTYRVIDSVSDIGFFLKFFPETGSGGPHLEKEVSTQTAFEGDTYRYSLSSGTSRWGYDAMDGFYYRQYDIEDVLPAGTTYAGNMRLEWVRDGDSSGIDLTGSLSSIATVTASGRNIKVSFNPSWLKPDSSRPHPATSWNVLYGAHGKFVLSFDAKVADDVDGFFTGDGKLQRLLVNDFDVVANGTKLTSNKVYTYVPPDPEKRVDKDIAEIDDKAMYTVEQKVNKKDSSVTQDWHYDSLVFKDTLPQFLSYNAGSFKVVDPGGNDVTARGKLVVDKVGTQDNLTFTFDNSYVRNSLPYNGGKFTFTFSGTVADPGHAANTMYVLKNTATTLINNHVLQTNEVRTSVPVFDISVVKRALYPDLLVGNPAYSLKGAVFSVVDSRGVSSGTAVTDADGKTAKVRVTHSGNVTVTETAASPGHKLADPASQSKRLTIGMTETVVFTFDEPPVVLDLPLIAQKRDADCYLPDWTGRIPSPLGDDSEWQGDGGDFSGFKVRVDFYAGRSPSGTKLASAAFEAKADGSVDFATGTPVDGTTWRYRWQGRNVIPLGCVTVTEVAAPTGYLVNGTTYIATVEQDGYSAKLVPGSNWKTF